MSKASHGAPTKRKKPAEQVADVGTAVKIDRPNGDGMLGIVRERQEYDEYDAPARVTVEGSDTEVNTSVENVEVAEGTHAQLVQSIVGGDGDV